MSSPIDYIFMKSLNECVVIIISIRSSSRISIEFMMRNTILALDDLCCHQPLNASSPTPTCSCFVLYLEFLAIQQLFFFTLEYYHLLCQECHESFTTSYEILDTMMLLTIIILLLVPVLSELCYENLISLATLLLQS